MLIPLNKNVLLLAERWLKLLSELGRTQATLSPTTMPFSIFLRSAASAGSNLKRPGLKIWTHTSAPGCPAPVRPHAEFRQGSCLSRRKAATYS